MLEDFQGTLDIVLRLDIQQVHFGGGITATEQLNVDRARRRRLLRRKQMRHRELHRSVSTGSSEASATESARPAKSHKTRKTQRNDAESKKELTASSNARC